MDNLELLTDDELRLRLLQYGYPNLPVTQTTRKILIKKLRNLLANSTANLRKTTNLVTRYSSGEESDSANNNNNKSSSASKARKASRLTISGSPSISSASNSQKNPYPPLFNNYSQALPSKTITTTTNSPSSAFNRNSGINLSSSSPSGKNVYISPVIINDSEDDDIDWNLRRNRSSSSHSGIKSFQTRSNNSSYERANNNGYENEDDEEEDSNTTSEYTKRLLQFRQEGSMQQQQKSNIRKRPVSSYANLLPPQQYQPINENDIVYHAESYSETASVPLRLAIKNFINRLDAAYGFKQTFVPMVLVTVLFIFFALIIFMYITISPDIENALNPSITTYTICDHQHENEASFKCIEEQNLMPSLNLLKVLASELQKRAISQKCGRDRSLNNKPNSIMCIIDFWNYLNDNQHHHHKYFQEHLSVLDVMKNVHNIEYLIDRNKQWGISNVDSNGKVQTLDEIVNLRAHQAECFAMLSPKLPITCTLYNKLQTFFIIIGTLAIIATISFAILKFYHFVLHVKEKKRAQVNYIVNEIVRMLMEKTVMEKDNKNAFLVVNHLRDKIIEPGRRSELASAWSEAITYLEQNDSRINFGFENINGEDFKVIRWIDDIKNLTGVNQNHQQSSQRFSNARYNPPSPTSEARLKKWMCPAFDKSNKIKDPPTNCLKIRQMFEKYETNTPNFQAIIQDTILHKVYDKGCKIFDIQLDLNTCCTYVKCATSEDAGIVHEELNGWWLDNRLVVVKFLKEEKYNQRFPNSINACTILYPSSTTYSAIGNNYTSTNGHDFEDDIEDEDNDDFE